MSRAHSALAVLVVVVWGANFAVIDAGLGDVPPWLLLTMRFVLLSFPLVFLVPKPQASWPAIAAVGLFMSLGQFGLLYVALNLGLPVGVASILLQAQVIFTVILAALALSELPTKRQGTGAVVGTVGLIMVAGAHAADAALWPVVAVLGAAASWAVGNVVSRKAGAPSGFSMVVWSALFVPIPALALSLTLEGPDQIAHALTHLTATAIAATLYTAVGSSLIGYGIWNSLIARYPTSAVAPYILLVPIVGIAVGWAAQGEVPTTLELVGGAVMLAGVAWATIKPSGQRAPSTSGASASLPR